MIEIVNDPIDGLSDCTCVADVFRHVLNQVDKQGLPVTVMRDRIRVLDAVDGVAVGEPFELNAKQWTLLEQLFSKCRWTVVRREICEIGEQLRAVVG